MQIEEFNYIPSENVPKIRVVIRKRPLNKKESQKNEQDIIEVREGIQVIVSEQKTKVDLTKYIENHNFTFDSSYDENMSNEEIYNDSVRPLVDAAFNQAKVTCFAYGQTGSGKTYTMMGYFGSDNGQGNRVSVPGLYLLAAQDIFGLLQIPQYQHLNLWISFYEIYCGKCYDLLNDRQHLPLREDAKQMVNIVGLQERNIQDLQTLMQLIDFGMKVRTTSATGANLDSSRSHAILQIVLKDGNKVYGKMSFIDLAGSERAADVTEQNKQTRVDGAEINKSLLALKECIRALDQNKNHTPFRGSKLTLVLRDSFIGNCKTVMIGNISPGSSSCENTLNTLRYADRIKELKKAQETKYNQQDLLALQLMLPRQQKNSTKITPNNDQNQNINYNNLNNNNNNNNIYHPINNYHPHANQAQDQNRLRQQSNKYTTPQNQVNQESTDLFNNCFIDEPQINPIKQIDQNVFGKKIDNNNQVNFNKINNNVNNNMPNTTANNNSRQSIMGLQPNPLQNMTNNYNQYQIQLQQQQQIQQHQQYNNLKQQPQNYDLFQLNNNNNNIINNENIYNQQLFKVSPYQNNLNQNNYGNNQHNNGYINGNIYNINNNNISSNNNLNSINNNQNIPNYGMRPVLPQQQQQQTFHDEKDLEEISIKHEKLIQTILNEEENLINVHRKHIDDTVELTKKEMNILHEVDKPGSDVDSYVENLEQLLNQKMEMIKNIRDKVVGFRQYLKEEEALSNMFYQKKNQFLDVFDLQQDMGVEQMIHNENHLLANIK